MGQPGQMGQPNQIGQQPVQISGQGPPPPPPQPGMQYQIQNSGPLICKIGQDALHEIILKATELFTQLRTTQLPPNANPQNIQFIDERKKKISENMTYIATNFKRLRKCFEKVNELSNKEGVEYVQQEELIPIKTESSLESIKVSQERKQSPEYLKQLEEVKALTEQLRNKNRQLKEVMDHTRNLIWEINTMLAIRKP